MENRSKLLMLNTITSVIAQVTVVICGFIIPRLILVYFGSEVNGLVNSITQFLGVITLLELGIGAVVQSSLYKPLADRDNDEISRIYVSANRFFHRVAIILLFYVVVLIIVYPRIVEEMFDYWYTVSLIGAMFISLFAQYYFGIVNSLLITSDQRGYIQYLAQIITLIINVIVCVILIKVGASIQLVKLTTSVIYLGRPLVLLIYVRKNYLIDTKIKYSKEPIKQKWNGMAQHFASFVLTGTDNIILTLLSTLQNVSIYSVYGLVITGVQNLFISFTNGVFPFFGDLWARHEKDKLEKEFAFFEWLTHVCGVLIYGCTGVLIVDFVRVYTDGVNDANYIQPLFAAVLVCAYGMRSIRIPYNYLILATGHYKQTQSNYIIAMIANIVISIIMVFKFGLIGVAIGTFVAMAYQTIWMAWYDYRTFLVADYKRFFSLLTSDVFCAVIGVFCSHFVTLHTVSYQSWFLEAVIVFFVWFVIILVYNALFFREMTRRSANIIFSRVKRTY